ncbi:Alpha-1,3-mannosyltransferase-like protein [Entomophthora muscae]|uniref:Alpha-1,3-mannosyltransferase-like protein n=1 Tax=Entomophthora muscae TaxID=34485 RepID=A0ACC2TCU0_9FUNG|nr:Alpha-1,3-mannosyltransferase-like protein [Entomophthora muscae]
MNICFVHPDLGIGGAERLVVDAAAGLVRKNHNVVIYTSYHNKDHCFEETRDGTLEVRVLGNDLFPSSLFGNRFRALCAYLRNLHLAAILWANQEEFDVIIVDQISTSIPILRQLGKVLFYCHFPDKLLTQRETFLKSLYRWPIDLVEEWTTGQAEKIVVNSKFTLGVFEKSFPSIKVTPDVLYPSIHTQSYDRPEDANHPSVDALKSDHALILSINRFERKKNIGLSIKAFASLIKDPNPVPDANNLRLVVAGGYDPQCIENVEHLRELDKLAKELGLETHTLQDNTPSPASTQVVFLPSFSTPQRTYLLTNSRCLVYTPSNEHFGIVPVEAMYAKLPVVAVNSGGPRESIQDGETGYLVEPETYAVADAIRQILSSSDLATSLGEQGRARVEKMFTSTAFDDRLLFLVEELACSPINDTSRFSYIFAFCVCWFLYPFIALFGKDS